MGWTTTAGQTMKEMKNELRESAARNGYKTLAERTVGKCWYRVMEHAETGNRFIAVYLIRSGKGYVGYKPMEESQHPFYYDCPLQLLDIAGPTQSQMANEWRQKVRELAAQKAKA